MCNINYSKFPCRICAKNAHGKDKAVQCDLKCNKLNYLDYSYLQNSDQSWCCKDCSSTIFPFNSLSSNKNFLACCANTNNNITQWRDLEHNHDSTLSLKPSSNLELLVSQFSNATPENSNDPEKISSSKYYDIEEMHNIEIPPKNQSQSLFHINACSLNKNFDDCQHILSCNKTKFDIKAISETRITKQESLSNNLNLNNYSFEFTPAETSAGGTLLYIANHLSHKCHSDLNIYKKN